MNPEKKSAVLVVGFHHSGTSMMAEMVGRLGFFLGEPENMLGPTPHNPRGHFENLHALRFNELVLTREGGSWANPPHDTVDRCPLTERVAVARLVTAGHPHVAVKDPRLCLMLPLWWEMLHNDLGYPIKIVQVMRNPYNAARSVSRLHANVSTYRALLLWSQYMERVQYDINRHGLPVAVFNYEHVLADPNGQAKQLATFLEADGWEEAAKCVIPNLKGT